jgi:hypothetical protein
MGRAMLLAAFVASILALASWRTGRGGPASAAETAHSDAPRAVADPAAGRAGAAAVAAFGTDLYRVLARGDGGRDRGARSTAAGGARRSPRTRSRAARPGPHRGRAA